MSQTTILQDHFMTIAFGAALGSKDPRTKVGACIVDGEGKIVGVGCNRLVKDTDTTESYLMTKRDVRKEEDGEKMVNLTMWVETKYPYMVYADVAAILNEPCSSLKGCTLYTLVHPVNESAKLIVETGIKEVIYYSDKYDPEKSPLSKAAERILKNGNVKVGKFKAQNEECGEVLKDLAKKTVNIPKKK